MQTTTAGNLDAAATPPQLVPVVIQQGDANPGQPPSVPVVVYGSPYYHQGAGVPYVAPQPQNNKTMIWILAAIACCIVFFGILGIIAVVVRIKFT